MSASASLSSVSLDDLRVQPTAYFYKTATTLDAHDLDRLLHGLSSDGHARRLKKSLSGTPPAHVAAVIRKHTPVPGFMPNSGVHELRFSLVLLVAVGDVLAVYTTGGGRWSESILGKKAVRFESDIIVSFLSEGATFQKVKMRSMSISPNVIRTRTLESPELESVISPQGLNRQIPESAIVRKKTNTMSATPSTARVAVASDRVDVDAYVAWVRAQRASLLKHSQQLGPSLFLSRFAAPVAMSTLDANKVYPTGILLGLEWLLEGIATGALGLERSSKGVWAPVADQNAIAESLAETGVVGAISSGAYAVNFPGLPNEPLLLYRNKKSFRFGGRLVNSLYVTEVATGNRVTLARRISEEDALFVTLSDIQYAYAFGQLFRDRTLSSQVETIRQLLHPIPGLVGCTSEKGSATATTSSFSSGSVFRLIEKVISRKAEEPVLLLDDLGDEWADFIGVGISRGAARISLYHAKHKQGTGTGASSLHEVVAQALKNLGRVAVRKEELEAKKKTTWAGRWAPTRIKRLRRGASVKAALQLYADASNHTGLRARVCLVVSFISKADIEQILSTLTVPGGTAKVLKPHETQLLHLLVAFIAQTREANAEPVVFCAP